MATSKTLYEGRFLKFVQERNWEFVKRKKINGIVGIVAVTEDGNILLIEQFRPPLNKNVIELPAGLAGDSKESAGEPLVSAAKRELREETGYEARRWKELAAGTASAGMSDEVITLFQAKGLKKVGEAEGDGDEQITVHEVHLAGAEAWLKRQVKKGKLVDLKVYAGLNFARL